MRDIDLMVTLLEDMADKPDGQLLLVKHLGMSEREREQHHNAELLGDAGLATWKSDSTVRITNDGYDFLSAVRRDRPKYTASSLSDLSRESK